MKKPKPLTPVQLRSQLQFRRGLYQRLIDGETLVAGEQYIYLGTYGVEFAFATEEDINVATLPIHAPTRNRIDQSEEA